MLDGVVQSSPVIQERIPGSAEISGTFTEKSASDLANVLKYGALPMTFDRVAGSHISATLGKQSLKAGLLAGAIGLGLVVIYSFIYYRAHRHRHDRVADRVRQSSPTPAWSCWARSSTSR